MIGEKKDRERFILMDPSVRIKCSEHKLKYSKFYLNVRNNFLCAGAQRLKRLPREAAELPPLDIFKTQVDIVLGNPLSVTLL